jgi:hypothetical protein
MYLKWNYWIQITLFLIITEICQNSIFLKFKLLHLQLNVFQNSNYSTLTFFHYWISMKFDISLIFILIPNIYLKIDVEKWVLYVCSLNESKVFFLFIRLQFAKNQSLSQKWLCIVQSFNFSLHLGYV